MTVYNKIRKYARAIKRDRIRKAMLKKEFKLNVLTGRQFLLEERSELLLDQLHKRIVGSLDISRQKERKIIPSYTIWIGKAAAIVVVLATAFAWHYMYNTNSAIADLTEKNIKEDKVVVQSNHSETETRLMMSDNSIIKLSPGSSISYYNSFKTGKRNISLSGKAIFEVTKDPSRPFTVFAGDISTTVLGTIFMMSTLDSNKIRVKLFEGKVVIRSATNKLLMQDVQLHAGQEIMIDKQARQFTVSSFDKPLDKTIPYDINSGNNTKNTALEFQQEPLKNVLTSIGRRYNVRFTFAGESFNNILVTGKFLPSDSLQTVLSMLGATNKLSFKQNSNRIAVTNQQ